MICLDLKIISAKLPSAIFMDEFRKWADDNGIKIKGNKVEICKASLPYIMTQRICFTTLSGTAMLLRQGVPIELPNHRFKV